MTRMIRLNLVLVLFALGGDLFAQAPTLMSFQGYLTDENGIPIDSTVSMTFRLYDGGDVAWQSSVLGVPVENGLFNIAPSALFASLDTVAFNRPLSLGVTMGDDDEITPRTPLRTVPYARALPGLYTYRATDDITLGTSTNVVGGDNNNTILPGIIGGVIGGGGGSAVLFSSGPNLVTGNYGTVSGGYDNSASLYAVVAGGEGNTASNLYSTVSGGANNWTEASYAVIPGGWQNRASGNYSFAAGYRAKVFHEGSFAWNDRSVVGGNDSLITTGANQFLIRAAGGVGIGTNAPTGNLHVSSGESGDAVFVLESDTDDNNSNDNPTIQLRQDGGDVGVNLGFNQGLLGSDVFGISRRSSGVNQYDGLALNTSNGNMGIGTNDPGSHRLRVLSSSSGGSSAATLEARNTNVGNGVAARFEANGTDVTMVVTQNSTGDLIKGFVSGVQRFLVNNAGDVTAKTFIPTGADLAEAFDVVGPKDSYEPGDVLVISPDEHRTLGMSTAPNSTSVAGVYATKPGVLLTDLDIDETMEKRVPLAVVGVVPTKVTTENGPIRAGDLLVTSSTPGHAMRSKPVVINGVELHPTGAVIGKALENFDGRATGKIEVLVGVR